MTEPFYAIQKRAPFEDSENILAGTVPDLGSSDEAEELFATLRTNSVAHMWLSAAWNADVIWYVIWTAGVPISFETPFGWSIIPRNQYREGRLPKDFTNKRLTALDVLAELLAEHADAD